MAPPTKLAHIVFRTNQLKAMKDWYMAVLEAKVTFANDKIAFLTFDDEHHRVALVALEDFPPRASGVTVGFYHAAFTMADLKALLDTHDRLLDLGIRPTRTINHGPTTSFYYRDPDGNDLELQVDRFTAMEDAKAWMDGPYFAANPVGILVDPGDLRARLESGVPMAELMRRADEINS